MSASVVPHAEGIVLPAPERDAAACLGPTDVIDSEHALVRERARAVAGEGTEAERAARLFAFVRDVPYDLVPYLDERASWLASATLVRGRGFCQQKAVLLAALFRAEGIPAGLSFQHIRDHKLLVPKFEKYLPGGVIAFHGLVSVWLGGRLLRVDPTLDAALCGSRGYRLVTFDGTTEALLPATDLAGAPHFDFLGEFGPFANLPAEISDRLVAAKPIWDGIRDLARKTGASM